MAEPDRARDLRILSIVQKCTGWLEQEPTRLQTEGIFRVSGSAKVSSPLQERASRRARGSGAAAVAAAAGSRGMWNRSGRAGLITPAAHGCTCAHGSPAGPGLRAPPRAGAHAVEPACWRVRRLGGAAVGPACACGGPGSTGLWAHTSPGPAGRGGSNSPSVVFAFRKQAAS